MKRKLFGGLLALVSFGFAASGCVPKATICGDPAHQTGCAFAFSDFQIDNPRFEFPVSMQPVAGGQDFWLRNGDTLDAAWDSFVLFLARPEIMCGPTTPVMPDRRSPSACFKCDFTNPSTAAHDCPMGFATAPGNDPVIVNFFADFDSQATPVALAGADPAVMPPIQSFPFTPPATGTVRLTLQINGGIKLAEAKVFVLSDGTQTVSYPLQPLAQNVTDVTFYSGTIPRNPVLADNFSTNLHIGKVRLLKGKPDVDPVTGKFRIQDAAVVKPSRIVFIPDYRGDSVFAHDSTRCYSDVSTDGNLDLTQCRPNAGAAGSLLDATPAYVKVDPQSVLTWIAEFRPSEGGIAPTLDAGEALAIEFTIQ